MTDSDSMPTDPPPAPVRAGAMPTPAAAPAEPVGEPRGPENGWMICEPAEGPALANEAERVDAPPAPAEEG